MKKTKKQTTVKPIVRVPCVEDRLFAARNQLVMLIAAGTVPEADSMIVDSDAFLLAIRTTARDAYEHVLSVSKALEAHAHALEAPAAPLFKTIDDIGGDR